MSSFWFDGGMERSVAMRSERSCIVASEGKASVTGLPWCVRVSSTVEGAGEGCGDDSGSIVDVVYVVVTVLEVPG